MGKIPNVIPVSFSSISAYETCPKQYYELRIAKRWKQEESEPMRWGNEVHKALENNIKHGRALPANMAQFQWGLDAVNLRAPSSTIKAELDVAMTEWRQPTGFWDDDAWARGKMDVFVHNADTTTAMNGDWKGLPLETPLPTPTGWTTMGDVREGDQLFDEAGKTCRVVGKSQIKRLPCFRITFDDGSTAECDDEHLWKLHNGTVKPIGELRRRDLIPVAGPLRLRSKLPLPVDPYVLGAWLADGHSTSGEITKPDVFIWEEIGRRGYTLGHDSATARGECRTQTVLGIHAHLRSLRVLGNKHIPQRYLRASYTQRLDLLRGIMDGDGSASKSRSQVTLHTVSPAFARDVRELALSLGQRAIVVPAKSHVFGKDVVDYRVVFTPLGLNPFLVPHKAERVRLYPPRNLSWRRSVVAIDPIGMKQTQCVSVDSRTHTYLCTESFIPTHNTGKTKPNSKQLVLSTLLCFANWPTIEKMRTVFFWLPEQDPAKRTTQQTFVREDDDHVRVLDLRGNATTTTIADMWEPFNETVEKMKWSLANNVWPANPSGLCKAWCPVLDCIHNGKRKK